MDLHSGFARFLFPSAMGQPHERGAAAPACSGMVAPRRRTCPSRRQRRGRTGRGAMTVLSRRKASRRSASSRPGVICPSSAFCVVCGQTVRVKSAVCGVGGSECMIGSEAKVASRKRFGCTSQDLPPEVVTVTWPASLLNATLGRQVERKEIHFHAASGFLLWVKMAFEPSPKSVQASPVGPARHRDGGDGVAQRRHHLVRRTDMVDGHGGAAGLHVGDGLHEAVRRRRWREHVMDAEQVDEPPVRLQRRRRHQPALFQLGAAAEHEGAPVVVPAGAAAHAEPPALAAGHRLRRRRGTCRNRSASAGSSGRTSPAARRGRAPPSAAAGSSACRPGARCRRHRSSEMSLRPGQAAIMVSSGRSASISISLGWLRNLTMPQSGPLPAISAV